MKVDVRRWVLDTPLTVSPVVRIANKYLVDGLRAYIVSKVKEDWPPTLEDWDTHEAEIEARRSVKTTSDKRASSSKPFAQSVPEPASAICFALEFGCPEILPAALYQLTRMYSMYAAYHCVMQTIINTGDHYSNMRRVYGRPPT